LSATPGELLDIVRAQFHSAPPAKLGVAVSGGGDSVALLHILAHCFDPAKVQLFAATVDHGLRPEAADEARLAGALAKRLGIAHQTLKWTGWDGKGNLSDQARRARYRLLAQWAKENDITDVALGHTADDQAETVLMRLIRSAGVTGLAGIPVRRTVHGIGVLRPLLGITRAQLRDYLTHNGVSWAEDPSNDDLQYDRVKARRALEVLQPLGLTAQALAGVAQNMTKAREALDWYSFLGAREIVTITGGDVVMDLHAFRTLPDEISRRLLQRALVWISRAEYPPRRAALSEALNAAKQGESATLSGCRLLRKDRHIWICREFNAVRRLHCASDQIWDGRWRLHGGDGAGCELRPLGQRGLMLVPDWRETGYPNAALIASPSVWRGDELVAAPLAGMARDWTAELIGGSEEFFASFLSH
jgi:tRNA(Ile)-lysidine synthase